MTHHSVRPKSWYDSLRQQPNFVYDAAQEAAVNHLDAWWTELVTFKSKRDQFLGHSLFNPVVPKGMYMWGGVGRGKTFLMDAFFACVPYRRKRRVHFHHFMVEAHQSMQKLVAEKDPLLSFARQICQQTRLLCLDELHIDNIADAMILGRLFRALFDGGVILMTTSNYPPEGLYPDGLQRQNFLPTIALLQRELSILNVDSGNDYRLRDGLRVPLYLMPDDAANEQRMADRFAELAEGAPISSADITLLGRSVAVKQAAPQVAWFEFHELCARPHGQHDFLALAAQFPYLLISHVPQLSAERAAEARRFTWLVDVFYDCRVKLVLSAACAPEQLYTSGIASQEFTRTVSRLVEMQSAQYWNLTHRILPPETVSG